MCIRDRTVAVPQSVVRKGGTYRARVRMRNGSMAWSHWSPPVQFVAAEPDLTALREGLVFNEIMYNPLGQAGVSPGEFEFLELKNIGESTLDLSGLFLATVSVLFSLRGACSQVGNFFCWASTGRRCRAAIQAWL